MDARAPRKSNRGRRAKACDSCSRRKVRSHQSSVDLEQERQYALIASADFISRPGGPMEKQDCSDQGKSRARNQLTDRHDRSNAMPTFHNAIGVNTMT